MFVEKKSTLFFLFCIQIWNIIFKDILKNEDLHLDDMFIASLVADLVKVWIVFLYFHNINQNFHTWWKIFLFFLSGNDIHSRKWDWFPWELEIFYMSSWQPMGLTDCRFWTPAIGQQRQWSQTRKRKLLWWYAISKLHVFVEVKNIWRNIVLLNNDLKKNLDMRYYVNVHLMI